MDIKKLREYGLVKGTGKTQKIGVPYKKEKGYHIRWVDKPSINQREFIKYYIENEPELAKKKKPKNSGTTNN